MYGIHHIKLNYSTKYRIMTILKVETDIATSITVNPIGRAVILVIMLVNT
jgi:hypothetical protein